MLRRFLHLTLILATLTTMVSYSFADAVYYRVRSGDDLKTISNKFYGNESNWKKILGHNIQMRNESDLKEGDIISIPDPSQYPKIGSNKSSTPKKEKKKMFTRDTPAVPNKLPSLASKLKKSIKKKVEVAPPVKVEKKVTQKKKKKKKKKKNRKKNKKRKQAKTPVKVKEKVVYREVVQFKTVNKVVEKNKDWKDKFLEMQKLYLESEKENSQLKDDLEKTKKSYRQVSKWDQERAYLINELETLRDKYNLMRKQNKSLNNRSDYFAATNLALGQEQVLKEKSKILTQRLWIEKNKEINECSLVVSDNLKKSKKMLEDYFEQFQGEFGSKSLVFDATENAMILIFPGNLVQGIINPRITEKYRSHLYDLGRVLDFVPYKKISISSNYYKDYLKDAKGRTLTKDVFSLKQGATVESYLNSELEIPSHKMAVGSHAHFQADKNQLKYFNIKVHFPEELTPKTAERGIASIEKSYKYLEGIANDILGHLGDPEYTSIKKVDGSLELHMGRSNFFHGNGAKLTKKGMRTINRIFNVFSMSTDVAFEVHWVPGERDVDAETNFGVGFDQVQSLRQFITRSNPDHKNRVGYWISTRYNGIQKADNEFNDKANKRLVFRIVPYSANARYHSP